MSREESNRLRYTIALVAEFANRFGIGEKQAFNYLSRFKGLSHLAAYYDVIHTQSFNDAVDAMIQVCGHNGGGFIKTEKIMTLNKSQIKMMQEEMYAELIQILMEEYGYTQDKAMETLYNSDTFARLQDADTGLYYQSPGYVYSFLSSELNLCDYRR